MSSCRATNANDEETQSWRDYRNAMIGNIDPEIMHQLDVIADHG